MFCKLNRFIKRWKIDFQRSKRKIIDIIKKFKVCNCEISNMNDENLFQEKFKNYLNVLYYNWKFCNKREINLFLVFWYSILDILKKNSI